MSYRRPHLWAPVGLSTEDSRRPSNAVTWLTYSGWQPPPPPSSTFFHRPVLPVQSHREPGRWQQPLVVMAAEGSTGAGEVGGRGRGRGRRGDRLALRRWRNLKFLENKTFTLNDSGFYLSISWSAFLRSPLLRAAGRHKKDVSVLDVQQSDKQLSPL